MITGTKRPSSAIAGMSSVTWPRWMVRSWNRSVMIFWTLLVRDRWRVVGTWAGHSNRGAEVSGRPAHPLDDQRRCEQAGGLKERPAFNGFVHVTLSPSVCLGLSRSD